MLGSFGYPLYDSGMANSLFWNWANYLSDRPHISYSMAGEDQILFHIINNLAKGKSISWLNIGAAHPIIINDTYFFYRNRQFKILGKRPYGVSIDARPNLRILYRFFRPREIFLNHLVGSGDTKVQDFFYNPYEPHNSSINENWARGLNVETRANQDIEKILANVMRLDQIYGQYPNLLQGEVGQIFSMLLIDTEGHDLEVLKSNDFNKNRPSLVAVEITFPTDHGLEIITLDNLVESEIHQFMLAAGYDWYAGNGFTQFYLEQTERM